MRKKYTNKSAGLQTKRKRQIRRYIFKCILLFIVIIILTIICAHKNNSVDVCYKESSNVDYKVYLKENEFYSKNYSEKNNQYIASLIDYIIADFNYELEIFEDDIKYDYKYRIEAEVDVKEKSTNKSIYNFTDGIVAEKVLTHDSNTNAKINEQVKIDYNKYNNLIKKFVSVYKLTQSESTLIVNMYISINGKEQDFTRDENDEYIVALEIPLTTNTVGIDINSNLVGCEETLITCEKSKFCWIKVIIALAILLEIIQIIKLINYTIKSRTPVDIYKLELNKILNNYGSYIQKVTDIFDLTKYQVIYLETFDDMLEIRDTIQEPVLMYEDKDNKKTCFMIPSKTNILYIFELKVNNMQKEIQEK